MKNTKLLSVLSIIFCLVYTIGAFALAVFPVNMCILFGMKKCLSINPDFVAHSINSPLPDEAYTIDHVYSVGHIGVIVLCLVPAIISSVLIICGKTKRLPIFLGWFSLFAFGISGRLIKSAAAFTLSSRGFSDVDFAVINSVHSFIMLFGFCGAALSVITAMHSKSRLSTHTLSIISICLSAAYLIRKVGTLMLTGIINEYDKYYSIAAVVLIVLSALSYFGKMSRRNAYFALELAAFFPLALQLLFLFGTGDYYGFMNLSAQTDGVSLVWLAGAVLCAVSSLKGVNNENPENS